MKVYQIVSETKAELNEGRGKAAVDAVLNLFKKKKPKGLEPSSRRAREYRDALKKNRAEAAKELAKKNAEARAAATARVSKFTPSTKTVLQILGAGYLAYDYWQEISYYESELKKELENPGSSTLYKGLSPDEAKEMFRRDANNALGSLIAQVAVLVTPAATSKIFTKLGNNAFLEWIPFLGRSLRWTGHILQWMDSGKVMAVAKVGAIYWLNNTKEGKEFLTQGVVGSILEWTGAGAKGLMDSMAELMQAYDGWGKKYVNAAGEYLAGGVAAATKDKPEYKPSTTDPQKTDPATAGNDPNVPQLWVRVDPKNPKIKYINNVQVTDDAGYLLTGLRQHIKYVQNIARQEGKPDPFEKIPRNPSKQYDY